MITPLPTRDNLSNNLSAQGRVIIVLGITFVFSYINSVTQYPDMCSYGQGRMVGQIGSGDDKQDAFRHQSTTGTNLDQNISSPVLGHNELKQL